MLQDTVARSDTSSAMVRKMLFMRTEKRFSESKINNYFSYFCTRTSEIMKKAILLALTALGLSLISSAQTVRTNYRAGGITHISTEYEELSLGEVPAQVRVELAGFQDGSTLYLLYINLVQKNATAVPKGVKMAVNLQGGKLIRLEQIGEDSATKRRLDNGLFLNRLKYAAEASDMVTDYLSAFGMEAQQSSYFADMLAYAQANSNTSAAQLGEAYRNCAANLNAAGQDVETTTSLLASMANQGLKGSEAGTALNAVMRRDYEVVQAVVLVVSLLNVLCTLVLDLLYGLIDPRVRLS